MGSLGPCRQSRDPIAGSPRISIMPNRIAQLPVVTLVAIVVAAVVVPTGASGDEQVPSGSRQFQTEQSFQLPGGRATRAFTLRERSGVILLNRLTSRVACVRSSRLGSRARRCARHELAGAERPLALVPAARSLEICTQGGGVVPDAAGDLAFGWSSWRARRPRPLRLRRRAATVEG